MSKSRSNFHEWLYIGIITFLIIAIFILPETSNNIQQQPKRCSAGQKDTGKLKIELFVELKQYTARMFEYQ